MSIYDRWHTKKPRKGPYGEPVPRCKEHKQFPSIDHDKGERWQVRWRDLDGNQCKRNFPKKAGNNPETCAEAFDAKIKTEISQGGYIDPSAGKITLRAFGDQWLEAQTFEESSRQTVRSRLDTAIYPSLGDNELRALKPSTVQAFVRGLQAKGLQASYVRVVTGILSSLLGAAVDDEVIRKNPCQASSVRLPKVVRRKVTPWPVERVFALADAIPKQYAACVDIGYAFGLRQGEILGLGVDDIDFLAQVRRQIRIVSNKLVFAPPKGGRKREVPLASDVGLRLSAHIAAFEPVAVTLPWKVPEGDAATVPLLFSKDGGPVHRGWFNMMVWYPGLRSIGVQPGGYRNGMHELRHTYASTLLAGGVDIRTLAEYLGHSDPGFTLRTYTHLMPSGEQRTRVAINRAFRGVATRDRQAR